MLTVLASPAFSRAAAAGGPGTWAEPGSRSSPRQADRKESGISQQELRINDRIRIPRVRVVGPDGNQVGILETKDALAMALEQDLDLVEVAPQAEPPVCRIMDYGK